LSHYFWYCEVFSFRKFCIPVCDDVYNVQAIHEWRCSCYSSPALYLCISIRACLAHVRMNLFCKPCICEDALFVYALHIWRCTYFNPLGISWREEIFEIFLSLINNSICVAETFSDYSLFVCVRACARMQACMRMHVMNF
jgi:hypothetical protein